MSYFSDSFIKLRTESGFKNAYSFYSANGGRRTFPFTYSHYLKIERGRILPQPSALAIMLGHMRRKVSVSRRMELMRAYLRDLGGDDAVYNALFAPLLAAGKNSGKQSALALAVGRGAQNLTLEQGRAIVSSPEAHGCFILLSNVPNALSVEEIAALTGSSREKCIAVIDALRRERLVVARKPGRYACAIPPERRYRVPTSDGFRSSYEKTQKNIDQIANRLGESVLHGSYSAIRLTPAALDEVLCAIDHLMDVSAGLSQKLIPPGPETPLYFIDTRVRRLFSFPPERDAEPARTAVPLGRERRPAKPRRRGHWNA